MVVASPSCLKRSIMETLLECAITTLVGTAIFTAIALKEACFNQRMAR
jgi:hypothetical protein